MASIISKKIKGNTYYYLAESARVGGKPRIVSQRYLGKATDIEAAMSGAQTLPERTRHLGFGDLAAALSVLRRLRVAEMVDAVVGPRREDAAASVGTYVELMVANRVVAPCSKLAFSDWWQTTAGDRMVKLPAAALDHRRFWDAMDQVSPPGLAEIHRAVVSVMVSEYAIETEGLVLDMTNVATYVDSTNERNTIAKRGHAKQKRHDLRIVGLSLIVTKDGAVPVASHSYPGNRPDVTQFAAALGALGRQFDGVGAHDQLTVVFDAGRDSAANLALVEELHLHFVGSVPPSQHPQLLAVPKTSYRVVDHTELPGVVAFETQELVLGRNLRVVLTHSDEFHAKQSRGFDQTLTKATAQLNDLARRLAGGRSRRARKSVEAEIEKICAPRWVSRVISVELVGTTAKDMALQFEIDHDARAALEEEIFGKRVLITDRFDWSTSEVVIAYRSQWQVEAGFRQLKDHDHIAVAPMFHWTDQKIAVHLFTCVLALSVLRLMVREVRGAGLTMTAGEIMKELSDMQETVLLYPSTGGRPRARRMLTEMRPTQERLLEIFGLEALAPPT
jgi:transposase